MAKQTQSDASFWAKHLGVAVAVLIVAGIVVYFYRGSLTESSPEASSQEKSISSGLSEFYREYRMTSTEVVEDEASDFVIELNDSDESLDNQLADMSSNLKPASRRWVGEHKYRSFKAGNTLREAITRFAQQEGMQVIWDLDQDFVIKSQFQMNNTIVGSLADIAKAVNANFENEVGTYVCPRQRSLVVTEEETPFLKKNCSEVN